jgi:protoheme IX farnesyltransferase
LFVFSIFYLFVLFSALLVDHGRGSLSLMRSSRGGCAAAAVHAELVQGAVRDAPCFLNLSTGEV